MKFVLAFVCVGAVLGDGPHFGPPHLRGPAPYAPAPYAPAPYAPAPAPYHPAPYVLEPARPFNYEYGVNDAYSGASFSHAENQVHDCKFLIQLCSFVEKPDVLKLQWVLLYILWNWSLQILQGAIHYFFVVSVL